MESANDTDSVVLEPRVALGHLDGRLVAEDTLGSTSRLLLAAGARRILVPSPPAPHRPGLVDTGLVIGEKRAPALPSHVKRIDQNGRVQDKVLDFLEPMTEGLHQGSRERTFVMVVATPLYRVLLGAQYKAAVFDADFHEVLHLLEGVRFSRFRAPYRDKLARVVAVACSYRPFTYPSLVPHRASGLGQPVALLDRIIDDDQYERLVMRYGRLGFLRHPRIYLAHLTASAREFVRSTRFRKGLRVAAIPATLASGPAGGKALDMMADAADLAHGIPSFAPPSILGSADLYLDLWRAAMAKHGTTIVPIDSGMSASFTEHTLMRCGHSAVSTDKVGVSEATQKRTANEWSSLLAGARRAVVT